jgi:hypothetical protein
LRVAVAAEIADRILDIGDTVLTSGALGNSSVQH